MTVQESDRHLSTRVYQKVSAQSQREELILGHLSLVRHILGRLSAKLPTGVDWDNLEAAGTLGLVEAANRFDSERGIQFKTFAYTRIRGAIYDELRRNCPLPQELIERITQIRKLVQTLPPPVGIDDLAKRTGMSDAEVSECLTAIRLTKVLSWDNVAEPSTSAGLNAVEQPDDRLEESERKRLLGEAIAQLVHTERVVVTLYYMEDLRLKEIGQVLNLSESRVSRLLRSAEHHIEEFIRAKEE